MWSHSLKKGSYRHKKKDVVYMRHVFNGEGFSQVYRVCIAAPGQQGKLTSSPSAKMKQGARREGRKEGRKAKS